MEILRQESDYTIEFNGSATYFVNVRYDDSGETDCIFATNTLRKANNFLNAILKDLGE